VAVKIKETGSRVSDSFNIARVLICFLAGRVAVPYGWTLGEISMYCMPGISRIHSLVCLFLLVTACWPNVVLAQICNLEQFLDTCPTSDPAYATIKKDFVIRKDDVLASEPTCQEPVSQMPRDQVSDELLVAIALRTIFYLRSSARLPWTSKTFYHWLHEKVTGINITSTGGDACCGPIDGDGRNYFYIRSYVTSGGPLTKDTWRSPAGVLARIALIAHERRHADGKEYNHVSCCHCCTDNTEACDQEYKESNLSPYAIQYWLGKRIVDGTIYTGYSCSAPSVAESFKQNVRNFANADISHFCTKAPHELDDANNPAGPCPKFCRTKVKQ
jgi:hypothetical protein